MCNLIFFVVVIGIIVVLSLFLVDICVEFIEGVLKDCFVLMNFSDCDIGVGIFKIDFIGLYVGLIFDVLGIGVGVEVF